MTVIASYHFSLESTGIKEIDDLLYAIAKAGKCFHCTSQWNEETLYGISDPLLEGNTPQEWIQNAANKLTCNMSNSF